MDIFWNNTFIRYAMIVNLHMVKICFHKFCVCWYVPIAGTWMQTSIHLQLHNIVHQIVSIPRCDRTTNVYKYYLLDNWKTVKTS